MIKIDIRESAKNTFDKYSMFVSFPYDAKIVNVIRELPIRYWNNDNKEWEVPIKQLGSIVNSLQDYEFSISGEYVAIEKPTATIPDGFEFKTSPFEHQIEGFNYGLMHDRWLLGDEMGLGKTKQTIDIAVAKKLSKGYKHCLIICGVNGLKWNWVNEVKTHSNEDAYILGQRVVRGKTVIGSNADKLTDVKLLANNPAYFIITNVETLRSSEIVDELVELCKDNTIGMIAFDELHKCKNAKSQQGKGILKLHANTMIGMSGTPLMNNPLDLYTPLKWLGYETHSLYAFQRHYCNMGGYGGYEVIGYKNLDELREKLDSIMLRRLKADVLDLPEKVYVDEYVEMTPKQKQIYDEVTNEIKMNIDQIKSASNPLAELIRMRQATGYTGILSSKIQESAKLDRMEELVEEALENDKQIVIFSNWTQMTDVIRERLSKYNCGVITGQTKDEERQQIVEDFQCGVYKIVIGTIGACGTGITLTAGTVEIFMDEPWNKANKEQAEDRCHRVGTTENITIYTLLCKDTIDDRIHDIVMQKGEMAKALVDGQLDKSRAEVLDFLLS